MVLAKYPKTAKTYPWQNLLMRLINYRTVRDDFGHLKLVDDKEKIKESETEGFLYVPRGRGLAFMSTFHKTQRKYDLLKTEFPADLTREIKAYIRINKLEYGDYLFHQERSKSKPRGQMSTSVAGMLKTAGVKDLQGVKNTGNFNLFRHARISEVAEKGMSANERQQLSEAMNHLPTTQVAYLRKVVCEKAYDPENILPVNNK